MFVKKTRRRIHFPSLCFHLLNWRRNFFFRRIIEAVIPTRNRKQIIGCLFFKPGRFAAWCEQMTASSKFSFPLRGAGFKTKDARLSFPRLVRGAAGTQGGRLFYNGGIVCARWQEKLRPPCFSAFFFRSPLFCRKLLWLYQERKSKLFEWTLSLVIPVFLMKWLLLVT